MQIEVFSDVVCPWCFIGKRRLEAALAQRSDSQIEVVWQPFELNPDLPRAGVPRDQYLCAKFGGRESLAAIEQRLVSLGRDVGIAFRFDRIATAPNTRAAHRLIAAVEPPMRGIMKERLLSAYFEQGLDIGDAAVLTALAITCGVDSAEAEFLLRDEAGFADVARAERRGLELGISGVPAFVFERRFLLSGAQPVHVMLEVIDHLRLVAPAPARVRAQG